MTTLIVHTKSLAHCPQCDMTLKTAAREGVATEEAPGIDTPARVDELSRFKELGLSSAPVVEALDADGILVERWAGFRPDKIKEYAA